MPDHAPPTLPVSELRVGLFIHLELGWMEHPFPVSSFKITSVQQIATLRELGLQTVRYSPDKSDPPPASAPPLNDPTSVAAATPPDAPSDTPAPATQRSEHRRLLQAQRQTQMQCERQHLESSRAVKAVFEQLATAPIEAGAACAQLTRDLVGQLAGHEESALRLLADGLGDRATLHAINVTVLSLLLGRVMGLDSAYLEALGMATLMHDAGKMELPERVRYRDDAFTALHFKLYQEHVAHGVSKVRQMGLPPSALLAISQHHEMADGSGFPLGLKADKMVPAGHILALINRYDGLCNPPNPLKALTPHEALSLIFASQKTRFESRTLNAFIRMMGVYPPGSVVQLTDERFALVMSVNSSRPLKPCVLVHDQQVASADAIWLDLQQEPTLSIQRSLRPDQLPYNARTYLGPRQRICYFFERAVTLAESAESVL